MSEAVPHPATTKSALWAYVATEVGLAQAALSLVALHLVDDAFLQPEPGMSVGDHYLSLLPVALVAGIAVLYPRLRPGARACWALVLGVLGIASGVEAAYYTVNGGPS